MNFPFRTAFTASQRFWVVMFSLSFGSRNLFISLLISSVTWWLFRNVLFNLHVFVFLTVFFFFSFNWYLVSYCCGQRRFLTRFQLFKIYWGLICDPRCGLSWRMFHVPLRKRCILLHWMECPEHISKIQLL